MSILSCLQGNGTESRVKVFQVEERKGNIRIKQVARTNIPTRLSCFNVITTIKLDDNVLFTVQCVSLIFRSFLWLQTF